MGRHPKDRSDYYRAKIWFSIIAESIGSSSPRHLERLFQPNNLKRNLDGKIVDSRSWDKYKKGDRLPKDGVNHQGFSFAVHAAESVVPDSAYIFRHPLWYLLGHGGQSYSQTAETIFGFKNYVRRFYFDLDLLSEGDILGSFGSSIGEAIAIGSDDDFVDVFDHLYAQSAILNIVNFRHREEHYFVIAENLSTVLRHLAKAPWIRGIYQEFFDYLEMVVFGDLFDKYYMVDIYSRSAWRKSFP